MAPVKEKSFKCRVVLKLSLLSTNIIKDYEHFDRLLDFLLIYSLNAFINPINVNCPFPIYVINHFVGELWYFVRRTKQDKIKLAVVQLRMEYEIRQ